MKTVALAVCALAMAADSLAGDLRDPMRPPQPRAAQHGLPSGAPVVAALFIGPARRAAIVNGRLVHEGDTLGDVTIVALLADGIRYQRGGALHEQRLLASESRFKKPAASLARVANGGS
jgi:hypothetical protein